MKILIVDDDENSRIYLERALRAQKYEVESAPNGVIALEKARQWRPDMVISDILMPEMNGFELCRRIKTDEQLRKIPFVFYTATFVDKKDEQLAMSLGASRFLIKPMDPADFFKIIGDVIKEYEKKELPVYEPMEDLKNLCQMYGESVARKLDKKVRELEAERKSLRESEEKIRKLNQALEYRATELERAYKDMESYSYAASHDLKAPLTRIIGFSKILLEDYANRLDDDGKNLLCRIADNTEQMRQVVSDLLEFSSLTGRKIKKAEIPMEALVRSVYEELVTTERGRNIQFQIKTLPSAFGDLSLVRHVVLNLLSNAVKFTRPKETATIEVGGYTEKDENIYYVKDNGIGFDMQFADKLFRLFQKIHISKDFEGTGTGLVIAKRIIELHDGKVWAEGKPEEGATFYFSLPVKVSSDRPSM